jgi:hypothetical protein
MRRFGGPVPADSGGPAHRERLPDPPPDRPPPLLVAAAWVGWFEDHVRLLTTMTGTVGSLFEEPLKKPWAGCADIPLAAHRARPHRFFTGFGFT